MARPTLNSGWKLPADERARLLALFPPRYAETVADHVTLKFAGGRDGPLPAETEGLVVGRGDDGHSLECLVVEIGGTTDRPDGSTYHITWSLGAGRKAKESNDVLRDKGWTALDTPLPIQLRPARF
jgi:hypothetical protein